MSELFNILTVRSYVKVDAALSIEGGRISPFIKPAVLSDKVVLVWDI